MSLGIIRKYPTHLSSLAPELRSEPVSLLGAKLCSSIKKVLRVEIKQIKKPERSYKVSENDRPRDWISVPLKKKKSFDGARTTKRKSLTMGDRTTWRTL